MTGKEGVSGVAKKARTAFEKFRQLTSKLVRVPKEDAAVKPKRDSRASESSRPSR